MSKKGKGKGSGRRERKENGREGREVGQRRERDEAGREGVKLNTYLVFRQLCSNGIWVSCDGLHFCQLLEGIGEPRPQLIIGLLKLS